MRKLIAVLMSLAMVVPAGAGIAELAKTQTRTPVVAASFVDASYRTHEKTSRNTVRTTETNLVSSDEALIFEKSKIYAIPAKPKVIPKAKPKVTIKKTIKIVTPKVIKTVKKPVQQTPTVTKSYDRDDIVIIAKRYLGVPYVWGGTTPSGFDCSGFTQYVYRKAGISIPRTSRSQYAFVTKISKSSARPGDLIFYGSPIHHVAIYLGGGLMLDAPHRGTVVQIRPIYYSETPKFGRVP